MDIFMGPRELAALQMCWFSHKVKINGTETQVMQSKLGDKTSSENLYLKQIFFPTHDCCEKVCRTLELYNKADM